MATYHHIYTNNPTAGSTDGTMVSEGHVFTAPITVTLNASQNEEELVKCAIRCDENYYSVGTSTITLGSWGGSSYYPGGGNTPKFALSFDKSTAGSLTYTLASNPANGDQGTFGELSLIAGTDFAIGDNIQTTATNIATAINNKSAYFNATNSGEAITVMEKYPGSGHTPVSYGDSGSGVIKCTFGTVVSSAAADQSTMKAKGEWTDTLSIQDMISDKNLIFWIKIQSSSDEAPQRDDSVGLLSYVTIAAKK